MLVYRIEHAVSKTGPYQCTYQGYDYRLIGIAHNNNDEYPTAKEDNINYDDLEERRFGFNDIYSLLAWFDGWLEYLHEQQFVCSVYNTTDVRNGTSKKQVCFDNKKAFKCKEISLNTILKQMCSTIKQKINDH